MPRSTLSISDRFWAKVRHTDTCWVWIGSQKGNGYGSFWNGERNMAAHRFAYEMLAGPIPEGLTLDHLCRNRVCVNPDHLEPVTHGENIRRGVGLAALNVRKTHCLRGHPLTPENIYVFPGKGGRNCRICRRIREARRKPRSRPGRHAARRERVRLAALAAEKAKP